MKWQLKLIKNYAIALLPMQRTLRTFKRRLWPYPAALDDQTLEQGLRQIEMLRAAGISLAGKVVLELGTGWKPTIPFLFMLAGCREVLLVDSQRLLDRALIAGTARALTARRQVLAERLGVGVEMVEQRLRAPAHTDLNGLLRHYRMRYLAPFDARRTGLPKESVDIVISRAVLEHVPPPTVDALFAEFARVLKHDGAMCYVIDNSDHWEHGDKSISRVNFLKFPDRLWRVITINPLDYQNRLRHFEYAEMLRRHGFDIVLDWSAPDSAAVEALKAVKVCERYRHVPHEALAILTSYVVAARHPLLLPLPLREREEVRVRC